MLYDLGNNQYKTQNYTPLFQECASLEYLPSRQGSGEVFLLPDTTIQSRVSARRNSTVMEMIDVTKDRRAQVQRIVVTTVYLLFAGLCTMTTPLGTEQILIWLHRRGDRSCQSRLS